MNVRATNEGSLPFFSQNWLQWQRPLRYRGPDRSSASKTLSFGEKIAKIGPANLEIIVLRAIIKRFKKLTQAKYIALSASLPSGLNKVLPLLMPQVLLHFFWKFIRLKSK